MSFLRITLLSIAATITCLLLWSYFENHQSSNTVQRWWNGSQSEALTMLTAEVLPRSFQVNVNTIGELEAARSTIISSSIRGDLGKVIYLANDGMNVEPGDILVKMDPSPFEEKVSELSSKIKDQKAHIGSLLQTLHWEQNQSKLEQQAANFELETAELELKKIVDGDGPLELFRLRSAMHKALTKYEELDAYSEDLAAMEAEGYLNASERKQAEKKLLEEKETYENCAMQYETFHNHVLPMQIKKAETTLHRVQLRQEEVVKGGRYKIDKAWANLKQARQVKRDLINQYRIAQQELAAAEIHAPAPGMVVLREEYRAGQKRKPRVGDIAVKNQPLLDLPDLNSMVVKTKVREVDLYKVALGKAAVIEVDAYPQIFFEGSVHTIGVLALADFMRGGGEKFFEVKIALNHSDARLRPGMTARVTILADQVNDQLAVPIHALFDIDKAIYCYVKNGSYYSPVPVHTGSCNEQWAAITDGLEQGEHVSLSQPPHNLIKSF
jgi:HlyD family secretion protein